MKDRNLKLFYLHELLFRFSDEMLIIVLPIFIYQLYNSISAVFIIVMIWNLIHGILFIPIFNLAMRSKKPKYFMVIGILLYVVALFLFGQVTPETKDLMIPATILFSLYISFYWMVRHWFTSKNVDTKKIGKQMSYVYIIRTLVAFVAPIVGGALAYFVSFNVTFLLGASAAFLSLIPIFMFNAPPDKEQYSFKKVLTVMKQPEVKAVSAGYFWEGIGFTFILNVWVLIFAIYIGNILDLGLLVGVTTLLTTLVIWMAGQGFDHKNRKAQLSKLTKLRAVATALYVTVFFFPHLAYVWLIEFLNRLTFTSQYTTIDSYLYSYGSKIHPVHFPMVREVYLNISRLTSAAFMAVTFYFLPPEFLWLMLPIGALSVLGMKRLSRSDHLLH